MKQNNKKKMLLNNKSNKIKIIKIQDCWITILSEQVWFLFHTQILFAGNFSAASKGSLKVFIAQVTSTFGRMNLEIFFVYPLSASEGCILLKIHLKKWKGTAHENTMEQT